MTQVTQKLAEWIFNVLQPQYIHKELAFNHICIFLQRHLRQNLNFAIRTKVYTSIDSGQSNLLVNLFGSIPVDGDISVPVEIWLPLSYPFTNANALEIDNGVPMVYIVPDHSKNWYLKPGNYVDTSGRFYHPYLSSWFKGNAIKPTPGSSYSVTDLLDLIHEAVVSNPPIYSPARNGPIQNSASVSPPAHIIGTPQLPPKPPKIPINARDPSSTPVERQDSYRSPQPPLPHHPQAPQQTQQNLQYQQSPQLNNSQSLTHQGNQFYQSSENSDSQQPYPLSQQTTGSSSGPPLPQKPSRTSIDSPRREFTPKNNYQSPPPFGGESSSSGPVIPDKYRSPPPLPAELRETQSPLPFAGSPRPQTNSNVRNQVQSPVERFTPLQGTPPNSQIQAWNYYQSQIHQQQQQQQPLQVPPQQYNRNHLATPIQKDPSIDLLDSDSTAGPQVNTGSSNEHRQILEQLANKINAYLTDAYSDSIDNSLPMVRETQQKVDALYGQLNHIYQHATENSTNLDNHISYLTQQLSNITALNKDLAILDEINAQSNEHVSTSQGAKIHLDDLIIPDSPLVKQLYETVSEIKAIKDTINLVSGSFHSEKEIINDNRIDVCVKTVRNLGRELFWLELTKQEIAHNIMGLPPR
ncbi:UEV domain-containing protein [Scheffersomyces xylosifermentans]|uniref:UEV domain-containing protein n=1 Tax=Scheffersomyces xylosifermentans TaxID=1304137 RepID=UPI00315D3EC3